VYGQWSQNTKAISSLSVRLDTAVQVLPVSVCFFCMVCSNNWFLLNVGVGFYAIAKTFSIPCSVVLSFLVLGARTSMATILACLVITAGVFLGSYSDAETTIFTLVMGLLASVFTAGYQVAVKHGLNLLDGDQWKLGWYNALWCVAALFPVGVVIGEGDVAVEALFPRSGPNWSLMLALGISGIVGFLVSQATYLSIHYTSALAHHVTGSFKSCVQTVLGVFIWSEPQTVAGVSGLLLTLAGSYGFFTSRMQTLANEPPPPPPQPPATPVNDTEKVTNEPIV